jgi:hypothetical protein
MKCVYCKKKEADKEKGVYPFCTERCKLLDLGAWANEEYRVPAYEPPTDDDELATTPHTELNPAFSDSGEG